MIGLAIGVGAVTFWLAYDGGSYGETSRAASGVARRSRAAPMIGLAIGVGAVTFWLAYDGGSYGETSRAAVGVALWWLLALLVGAGFAPRARLPRAALIAAGSLGGFAALALASAGWADSAERALIEFSRAVLYLGVFLLAALVVTRDALGRCVDGLTLGIAATGLLALCSRLFSDVISSGDALRFLPSALARLSYPLDYWNGLAIFVSIGVPLLLRAALLARLPLRAAAVASLPALAVAAYLTSSRGGVAAMLLGTVAFLALSGRRLESAAVALVSLIGSAAAVAVVLPRNELVNDPDASQAVVQGHGAAVLIALVCVLTAAVYVVGSRSLAGRGRGLGERIGPLAQRMALAAAAVLLLAGIAAADPVQRFERFKEPPPPPSEVRRTEENPLQAHILYGGSSGRWQQWETALDEFASAPLIGRGAGSYEAWWAEHGTLSGFNKDAHSLYFEVLGELGVLGFALIFVAFATGLLAGSERVARSRGAERTTTAAVLASFLAYAFGAGVDWMWEMTVVSIVGIALLGLLTGPATLARSGRERPRLRAPWLRRSVRAGAVAVALFLALGEAVSLLTRLHIEESQAAVRRGDGDRAGREALAARDLEPWAASPYLQVALVEEVGGNLGAARDWIEEALERDPADWRLWLVASRIHAKAGALPEARASFARARQLNPRSTLFTGRAAS
jgi:O-Antigen ligase